MTNKPAVAAFQDRPSGHVHELIAEVAKAAAHEQYAVLMEDNQVWQGWRKRYPGVGRKKLEQLFVATYWPTYIGLARATLGRLLSTSTDPALKERIHSALVLDSTLIVPQAQSRETAA